jgi:hypothetical protein
MWGNGSESVGKPGASTPTPPPVASKRYRCKLTSVADANRELQRVYRECRSGLLDVGDGSKLAHILLAIARIHEADLGDRVAALEAGR